LKSSCGGGVGSVFMKKRGAKLPMFAMWVDNAELLVPWTAE
jgi:hypothetical protein